MHWLQSLDVYLFHCVNPALRCGWLDWLMPFCSDNPYFGPVVLVAGIGLAVFGGARGRICLLLLLLAVGLGDSLICNTIKQAVNRQRPFFDIADAYLPPDIGRSDSGSMPSSHAANWFAMTMVAFIYYRRSMWFMLPAALLVSFSRIYNGVHYPSDVLAGAILGAGYAAGGVWTLNEVWQWAGRRWFPLWWQALPSLMEPERRAPATGALPEDEARVRDRQWLRLGYVLIFVHFAFKLGYLAIGHLDLEQDEAYQWIWSKHPALSYYSKAPMIAYAQLLSTSIWGDTAFGVRFFSPLITVVIGILMLRFIARMVSARAGFCLCVAMMTTPLLSLGATLFTVDPLSVMFWCLAMMAGWRAVQADARTSDWLWVGLWMGLGFLSKYTELVQLLCWAVFFALWRPARQQLRRPGPYLALLINAVCMLPVVIWNYQHGWITVRHVAEGGNLTTAWTPTPENLWQGFKRYTTEFLVAEAGVLNPFLFLAAIWAAIALWRKRKENGFQVYLFSMGAPLFLSYFLLSFRSRIQLNWIAPSVVPMFCLAAAYWDQRWRAGSRWIKPWLITGLVFGGMVVVMVHVPKLISKIAGPLTPKSDPLRRVTGWKDTADAVEAARQKLAAEGKPVFIIGGHYGITSEVTFYLPEAKAGVPDHPLAYYQSAEKPENQFFFWPGYQKRKGQNAIYVQELDFYWEPPLCNEVPDIPDSLKQEFESVKDLGAVIVHHRGKPIRRIQIAECRNLR